jgi:hypothetical protein
MLEAELLRLRPGALSIDTTLDEANVPLDQRLTEQAERLRKEARGTPPGVMRDQLIRQARQAETASHMQEWLSSPGLQPPR